MTHKKMVSVSGVSGHVRALETIGSEGRGSLYFPLITHPQTPESPPEMLVYHVYASAEFATAGRDLIAGQSVVFVYGELVEWTWTDAGGHTHTGRKIRAHRIMRSVVTQL